MEKSENTNVKKEILMWVVAIGCAVLAAFLVNTFVLINATIPSQSMEPTIMTNDKIFGNRLAYINSKPRRGDIIIFKSTLPSDKGSPQLYIKRIVGLPGDTVSIMDQSVKINGIPLEEPYAYYKLNTLSETSDEYVVPEDHYFVLGDNRDLSEDSRYWRYEAQKLGIVSTPEEGMPYTYVPRENILGKAVFRYYPFNKIGSIS
jgi:signal peptidase I